MNTATGHPETAERSQLVMSTRTDQGPRRYMADAARTHLGRAWAVADGIGDSYDAADAAELAAETAAYTAATGGAVCGILAARTALQQYYDGYPRGQRGNCVMVTAAPMSEDAGGGWDIAWVGDCRAYTLQDGRLHQVTQDHTTGESMRQWEDPYWHEIASAYDHIVERTVAGNEPIASVRVTGPADRLLLCSDGLSKVLPAEKIERILTADMAPRHMTRALINSARAHRKATDNIAVTVVSARPPQ